MKRSLCTLLTLAIGFTSYSEITFLKGTLAEATTWAAAEGKPVMVDFITDWCRWCDTLDARTYSDTSVAAYVNAHVIPIKIDAEKGEGVGIAKKYGVSGYPTILLIKSDGEEIDRMLGYVPAKEFLATLQDFVQGVNTISALSARVKEHPDDPVLRYAIAKKYADRNDVAKASPHFEKLLDFDPQNTLGHNEEAHFTIAVGAFRTSKDPTKLASFIDTYPGSPRVQQALTALCRSAIRNKDGESARKYVQQYLNKWPKDATIMNTYAWECAGQSINLDHAAELAKSAVDLATSDADRAAYLDTYATVRFAQGRTNEAITLEEQAIEVLKRVPNAKMKPYEDTLQKFRSARKSSTHE